MDDRRLPRRTDRQLFDDAEVARRFQRRLGELGPPRGYARSNVQFDESGYPIDPQLSLAARVRRLITG
jgi:hypothetical protein